MSSAVKEALSDPIPGAVAIEKLPFVAQRLALLDADPHDAHARHHAQDRTSALVFRWKTLSDQLPQIRAATMSCLEATESKGGAVVLRIVDRTKYTTIQESIADHQAQITAFEQAMRELDSLNAGWIDELRSHRDSLASTERQQRAMLTSWATSALQKNSHSSRSAEEILKGDQQYQDRKAKVEAQIARAKATLDELVPRLERIEEILSSCGC